jgi:hypothetical protein
MDDKRLLEMANTLSLMRMDWCPHYVSETGWRYRIDCLECRKDFVRQVRDETDMAGHERGRVECATYRAMMAMIGAAMGDPPEDGAHDLPERVTARLRADEAREKALRKMKHQHRAQETPWASLPQCGRCGVDWPCAIAKDIDDALARSD